MLGLRAAARSFGAMAHKRRSVVKRALADRDIPGGRIVPLPPPGTLGGWHAALGMRRREEKLCFHLIEGACDAHLETKEASEDPVAE
jgi:hypothetical protein